MVSNSKREVILRAQNVGRRALRQTECNKPGSSGAFSQRCGGQAIEDNLRKLQPRRCEIAAEQYVEAGRFC
jgi:hypothetical protein